MKSNEKRYYVIWRGDKSTVENYNGGGTPGSADKVMEYLNSMQTSKPGNYVDQKKKLFEVFIPDYYFNTLQY